MSRRIPRNGFSIIELMVVVAIFGVVASIGFSAYKISEYKNQLALAANTIAFDLRRAQLLSQAVDGDSSWGVAIKNQNVTIFKGASYAVRDVSADDTISLPGLVSVSGLGEIIFSKMNGLPQSVGTTTVSTSNGDSKNIVINTKGMVSY